jgi:hypothetical protein
MKGVCDDEVDPAVLLIPDRRGQLLELISSMVVAYYFLSDD